MEGFVERWMRNECLRPVERRRILGHDVILAHSDLPWFDQKDDPKLSGGYYTIGFAMEVPGEQKPMAIVRTDYVAAGDESLVERNASHRSQVLANTAAMAAEDFIRTGKMADFLHA